MPTEHLDTPLRTRRRVARVLALLLLALLPSVCLLLLVSLPLLPCPRRFASFVGSGVFLVEVALPWVVLTYLAYGGAVGVGAFWRPRPERRGRAALSLALLGGLAFFLLSAHPAVALRWHLLRQIPARARPLTAALEQFRRDNGHYPGSLARLTPRYLDRVPGTGVLLSPEFGYTRADPNDSHGRGSWLAKLNAGYDLSVHCPAYLISFDSLHYWPSQQYPERIPGGRVTRKIDGWVYVHD